MSLNEYQHATLRNINNKFKGWQEKEKTLWQRTHWQTLWLLTPHIKHSQLAKIERAMRQEWDPENAKAPEWTGDVKSQLAKWDEMAKDLK